MLITGRAIEYASPIGRPTFSRRVVDRTWPRVLRVGMDGGDEVGVRSGVDLEFDELMGREECRCVVEREKRAKTDAVGKREQSADSGRVRSENLFRGLRLEGGLRLEKRQV